MIELPDAETCSIFETICILADKANNPLNVNYNLGGWLQKPTFCGWNRGVPMSDCVKKKLSRKLKGKSLPQNRHKMSEETKQKISSSLKERHPQHMLGKKLSDETKKRMSESAKKVVHTDEWNKKVGDAQRGVPKSKESVEKMRQSLKGKKRSPEAVEKSAEAMRGCTWWTDGQVEKMSKECPGVNFVRGRCGKTTKGSHISDEQKKLLSLARKGTRTINKDGVQKSVKQEELQKWLDDGWKLGRK